MFTFAATCLPRFPFEQRAQGKLFIFTPMSKIPYNKPALTYADQIQQLKVRGLAINDDAKVLHLLEAISYYRLSGYWYPMLLDKKNHQFKPGSTFETAFNIYKFDRELRLLVLRELEKIEVAVRAKMIYILSNSKGAFWYKDANNFKDPIKHADTLSKMGGEYQRSDEQFIMAFQQKYSDSLPPSWMMLEIASFGVLSSLYSNLIPGRNKKDIAHHFGVNDKTLASWLHSIVYLRNVCAHHSRMWNRIMRIQPLIPLNTKNQWLTNSNVANNRAYFVLSMIIYLMATINPKNTIPKKFNDLLINFPNIDVSAMGFPVNWQQEPLWHK